MIRLIMVVRVQAYNCVTEAEAGGLLNTVIETQFQ